MENKELKKLINEIKEDDLLTLEEEIFFKEDIPNLDNEEIRILTEKAQRTLFENYKRKINYKNIWKNVMAVTVMAFMVTFVVVVILDRSYNYSSGQEPFIQNEDDLYVLNEPITKHNKNNSHITLQSLVLDTKNNLIYASIEGEGTVPKEEGKLTISGEEKNSNSNYLGGDSTNWILGHDFKSKTKFNYKEGETIEYTITTSDNEDITFDVNLKKLQGELDCSQLGLNEIKEDIAIIGRIEEKNNILDLKLSSVIEGNGANVMYYGEEYPINEYETGIKLKDSNGKVVKGKQIQYGDKFNHFEFDTTSLVKPYTIIVPKVTISISGNIENSKKIKINLPEKGVEKIEKTVELCGENYNNMTKNTTVTIKDIEKIGNNEYSINVDFPQNTNNKIKISSIELNPNKEILSKNEDFSNYVVELNEKSIMDKVIVKPRDSKKNTIEFRIQPQYYSVEGNWQLNIK
ncbi:hypothetical protein [Romboutsia sp.]|uniref:hypothetical protein n=1 Tax=Romboutsia sp. TaxID=1965302 RepID=UPI003F375297